MMRMMIIQAYGRLLDEAACLSGEEWRENRDRRKRMNLRAIQEYQTPIYTLYAEYIAEGVRKDAKPENVSLAV